MSKVFVILQHSGGEDDYNCNVLFAYLRKDRPNKKLEELIESQKEAKWINKEYWERYNKFQEENPILEWHSGFTDYDKQFRGQGGKISKVPYRFSTREKS